MSYRKHFAYYHAGGFQESFLCVCDRVTNHMVSRPGSRPAQLTLFDLASDGEMRA